MSSQRDDVFQLYPETLALPAGVTAVIAPLPGQSAIMLKYISGGSLSLVGSTFGLGGSVVIGTTFATSQLYTLGTGEIYSSNMGGYLYIIASGSTCVCALNRTRTSQPFNLGSL